MKVTWTKFSGIRPKVDTRLLPDGNAQVADKGKERVAAG